MRAKSTSTPWTVLMCLAIGAAALSCTKSHSAQENGDGGTDADADGDSDVDGDTDGDSDTDSDTDSDSSVDSDGDHLSDAYEEEHGTDPNDSDSDDDGYSDYIEEVAGTDPMDPYDNPGAEGWFYFLMPYLGNPDPDLGTLVFATKVKVADVFLLMDTTGSMSGAISNLKATLSTAIIPALQETIVDVRFGVGFHDDYPVEPYGSAGTDSVFALLQTETASVEDAQAGVDQLLSHYGNDGSESQVPSLWAIATGEGLGEYLEPQTGCLAGGYGYPCFRPGAMPIIVMMTDATFHNGPGNYDPYTGIAPEPPSYTDVVAALDTIHAKVLPVYNGAEGSMGMTHCEDIALDTGAVLDGEPLVFPINFDGTGLDLAIVDAVNTLVTAVPMDISAETRDDPADAFDATLLIDHVAPNPAGGIADPMDPTLVCVGGLPTANIDDDPEQDVFTSVEPGLPVCFDITPVQQNTDVPATDETQVFKAYVDVIGAGTSVLDTREVYFVVPPEDPLP
jgi:hypothetical protein